MVEVRMIRNAFNAAASFVVFFGLAIPFIPLPGNYATRIHVRFLTGDMTQPKAFTAVTDRTTCAVMATSIAFEDHDTGQFARVDC
jgi:hypothetical protein